MSFFSENDAAAPRESRDLVDGERIFARARALSRLSLSLSARRQRATRLREKSRLSPWRRRERESARSTVGGVNAGVARRIRRRRDCR